MSKKIETLRNVLHHVQENDLSRIAVERKLMVFCPELRVLRAEQQSTSVKVQHRYDVRMGATLDPLLGKHLHLSAVLPS